MKQYNTLDMVQNSVKHWPSWSNATTTQISIIPQWPKDKQRWMMSDFNIMFALIDSWYLSRKEYDSVINTIINPLKMILIQLKCEGQSYLKRVQRVHSVNFAVK